MADRLLSDATGLLGLLSRFPSCWSSHPYNLRLIDETSDRCEFRHSTLEGASIACEAIKSCGGITRDEGLRCGPLGLKMPYEIRSGVTLPGVRPPSSWLLQRYAGPNQSICAIRPTDSRPNESPRERWRRQIGPQRLSHPMNLTMINVSLLASGTLRGYLHCSQSIARVLVKPNMPRVTLTVATYDKNDCGGSSGHGLGLHAQSVDMRVARAAFGFRGLPVLVYNESTTRINDFFHMYRRHPHWNIFSQAVDRGAAVRYQSQFYLRHLAWTLSKSAYTDVVVLVRPDACMFGRWRIRRDRQKDSIAVSITLRDTSVCEVKIGPSNILLPYSDIHRGSWDDTFALGFGSSMHKYVGLYSKLLSHQYSGPFPHPEALLGHHLMKQGLHVVDACGAARGDILELVKQCKDDS